MDPGAEARGESDFLGEVVAESDENVDGERGSRVESASRRGGFDWSGGKSEITSVLGEAEFAVEGAESGGKVDGESGKRAGSTARRAGSSGGGGERGKPVGDVGLGIIANGRFVVRGLLLVGGAVSELSGGVGRAKYDSERLKYLGESFPRLARSPFDAPVSSVGEQRLGGIDMQSNRISAQSRQTPSRIFNFPVSKSHFPTSLLRLFRSSLRAHFRVIGKIKMMSFSLRAIPRSIKLGANFSTRSILAQAQQIGQKNPATGEYVGTVDLDVSTIPFDSFSIISSTLFCFRHSLPARVESSAVFSGHYEDAVVRFCGRGKVRRGRWNNKGNPTTRSKSSQIPLPLTDDSPHVPAIEINHNAQRLTQSQDPLFRTRLR